jgi:hydroxymethylpyrimidine/phosphomethylpyrimidine kinase
MTLPRCLTVAGSDSGGGAGIQADLKTFTVLKTYGSSAITALTAQNTLGVDAIYEVDADFVGKQIDAVLSDIGADAVKTGMLMSSGIVEIVADRMASHNVKNLVVDPVMVSKGGNALLLPEAVQAVRERLIPLAAIVTPNTQEAAILAGMDSITNLDGMKQAAESMIKLGAGAALIKAGHMGGESSDDLWFDGEQFTVLPSPRYDNKHTHGTGCTLSAAITAYLAHGNSGLDAVRRAKHYISGAIRSAWPLGNGIGPVDHLWEL